MMISKVGVFYKIVKEQSSRYLIELIPSNNNPNQIRYCQILGIPQFKVMNNFFLVFCPSALVEWNKLDTDIQSLKKTF